MILQVNIVDILVEKRSLYERQPDTKEELLARVDFSNGMFVLVKADARPSAYVCSGRTRCIWAYDMV